MPYAVVHTKFETFLNSHFLPPLIAMYYNPELSLVPTSASKTHFSSLSQLWALFDQSYLVYDHTCPSLQKDVLSKTRDECQMYFGSQALLKNHSSLHKTKKSRIRKAKKVVLLNNDEVLAFVEDDDEPERIALEEIDISEAEHLKPPGETLPVFTLDECFSTSWKFIQTQLDLIRVI